MTKYLIQTCKHGIIIGGHCRGCEAEYRAKEAHTLIVKCASMEEHLDVYSAVDTELFAIHELVAQESYDEILDKLQKILDEEKDMFERKEC